MKEPGSIAQETRDQEDFVNVKATADLAFIRFQPTGWWAGFTERCIVAEVTDAGVATRVPKTACVRVPGPRVLTRPVNRVPAVAPADLAWGP